MNDPYGTALLIIRADATVAGIVGDVSTKVSPVAADPPAVRLRSGPTSRTPFGPGSGRVGLQFWTGVAQCYGDASVDGEMVSAQLARAVSDAFHGIGAKRGTGTNLILRAWAPDLSEILRDPDTDWPYTTVRIEAYAAT